MDKYEFKVKKEEILKLKENEDFQAACKVAEDVDWSKVKNIGLLCEVADIFDKVGKYEEEKELLRMAYERSPFGRMIVYKLSEVNIKLKNLIEAQEYYEDFLEMAPTDSQKYILKYKLERAKGTSLDKLIQILEDLKANEFTEEYACELAYLYHRAGLVTRCVDECDQIFLWFGEGKYVEKALELKLLHEPLTPIQQERYEKSRNQRISIAQETNKQVQKAPEKPEAPKETIHKVISTQIIPEIKEEAPVSEEAPKEPEIKPVEVNTDKYNTINLQMELAANMAEVLGDDFDTAFEEELPAEELAEETLPEETAPKAIDNEQNNAPVFVSFGEMLGVSSEKKEPVVKPFIPKEINNTSPIFTLPKKPYEAPKLTPKTSKTDIEAVTKAVEAPKPVPEMVIPSAIKPEVTSAYVKPEVEEGALEINFQNMLNLETDGQMNFTVPDTAIVEKQITGQMSIEEIMEEWGRRQAEAAANVPLFESQEPEEPVVEEPVIEEPEETIVEEPVIEEPEPEESEAPEDDFVLPVIEIPDDIFDSEPVPLAKAEAFAETEPEDEEESNIEKTLEELIAESEDDESIEETIPAPARVSDNLPPLLSSRPDFSIDDNREIFTYFLNANTMSEQIAKTMNSLLDKFTMPTTSANGNILITGNNGSGKTKLATAVIKSLQTYGVKKDTKIGKLNGKALNTKSIADIMSKLDGGYLIIEKAGRLSPEKLSELSLALEGSADGLTVILEDDINSIRKQLSACPDIAGKFTEHINIPKFTNDELVAFGKVYALEEGYLIDEMGVLALYNCIGNIQFDETGTTLDEIIDIINDAIETSLHVSFKKSFGKMFKKSNDKYKTLHEEDFDN